MSIFKDFYMAVNQDAERRKQLDKLLDGKTFDAIDSGKLEEVRKLAADMGYPITREEAEDFFHSEDRELDEEALDAVVGGKNQTYRSTTYICGQGGQAGVDEGNFGEGSQSVQRTV